MAYSEYFNSGSVNNETVYYNYGNVCGVSHTNTPLCSAGHYNTRGNGSNYSNYSNQCTNTYDDVSDYLNAAHSNYVNHFNTSSTDKGLPVHRQSNFPLSWNQWSGSSGSRAIGTYISESVDAIKELRSNMEKISDGFASNKISDPLGSLASDPAISDNTLNDNNTETAEYVKDTQFDKLRDSLQTMWAAIRGDASTIPTNKAPGDQVAKNDWESLANVSESLFNYTAIGYTNHWNTTYSAARADRIRSEGEN